MAINVATEPLRTTVQPASADRVKLTFVIAWFFCLLFYFMQYAVRSAPSVMLP